MKRLFVFGVPVFLYCIIQHLVWAVSLMLSPDELHTTAIDAMYSIFPKPHVLGVFLFIISMGALWEIWTGNKKMYVFLILQQFVLLLSAWGALHAIVGGHFADMVVRSRYFILSDQVHHIIVAILHTAGIVYHARRE